MTQKRTAGRTKTLDVEPLDDTSFRFRLTLEDRSNLDGDEDRIHSLLIEGVLTVPDLVIQSIEAVAIRQPYPECVVSLAPVKLLAGAKIGPGFRNRVLEVMGKTKGCTHFLTLALDLAAAHTLTTFLRMYQTADYKMRDKGGNWMKAGLQVEPRLENACVALQSGGRIMTLAHGQTDSDG